MENASKSTKTQKRIYASTITIRAAIYEATGVRLTDDEVLKLLLEEEMLTKEQAQFLKPVSWKELNYVGNKY